MLGKKSSKNGFMKFCFSEQNNDTNLAGLSIGELVLKCSSRWEKMTASQKSHFQETGQVVGATRRPTESGSRRDAFGRSLAENLKRKQEEATKTEKMKAEIREAVELAKMEDRLEDAPFYIVHTNIFCMTAEKDIVPAELSLAKLSLREGVQSIDKVYGEVYQVFIEPGQVPRGYLGDCLANSKATHKIPLDFHSFVGDYKRIIEDILEILMEEDKGLPPIYCMPKHITQNRLVLEWLIDKSGTDLIAKEELRLYSLPDLLHQMTRASDVDTSLDTSTASSVSSVSLVRNRVPTVALAEAQLDRDTFMLMPRMSCSWHTEVESLYCCQAQVLSWAYILLSLVCPLRSLPLLSGRHKPEEEERLDWGVESVPGSVLSLASHEEDATSCRSEPQSQRPTLLKELAGEKIIRSKRGEMFTNVTQSSLDSSM